MRVERTAQHSRKAENELWCIQGRALPTQIFSGPQRSIGIHHHEIAGDESKRLRGLCDSNVMSELLEWGGILLVHSWDRQLSKGENNWRIA